MVTFKDFSRPSSVFQVLFRANLIFKDFSRQSRIFKYFSSLWEPCWLFILIDQWIFPFTVIYKLRTLAACQKGLDSADTAGWSGSSLFAILFFVNSKPIFNFSFKTEWNVFKILECLQYSWPNSMPNDSILFVFLLYVPSQQLWSLGMGISKKSVSRYGTTVSWYVSCKYW